VKDTVVVNVYLPCDNVDSVHESYMECFANISNEISELDFCHINFGGDLNTDFNTNKQKWRRIYELMDLFSAIYLFFAIVSR